LLVVLLSCFFSFAGAFTLHEIDKTKPVNSKAMILKLLFIFNILNV